MNRASIHQPAPFNMIRRSFLGYTAGGLGYLALAHLLGTDAKGASPHAPHGFHPLAPKPPHFPGKAKSVICLFQHGGPSQMDLFDPKPELNKWNGKDYPHKDLEVHFDKQAGKLLESPFSFKAHGQSGTQLSELLPQTGTIVDEITLVRSMITDSIDHESALRIIHTGKFQAGRPTWGSWVIYGLGTERQDLPAYVVLSDPAGLPVDSTRNWSSGWLPAVYQGTQLRSDGPPVFNLTTPADLPAAVRADQLGLLQKLNRSYLNRHPENSELQARLNNYEIAARMQSAVPEALNLSDEPESVRRLYGLDKPVCANYA